MSFWATRKRMAPQRVIAIAGEQRQPHIPRTLADTLTGEVVQQGLYHFHLGDVFTSGTGNWIPDPYNDTAVYPVWGRGTARNPYAFQPVPPGVAVALQSVKPDTIRGTIVHGIAIDRFSQIAGYDGSVESFNG